MNEKQNEQELIEKAKERVGQRIGLMIHVLCWLVISIVITAVVPEKVFGVRVGVLVFAFWGICVAIHVIAYAMSSRKITRGYDKAVQKEIERMKSEK